MNKKELLMRVVVGAAWSDGVLTQGEVDYLARLLKRQKLASEAALLALLEEPVTPLQLEGWIVDYLQGTTTVERLAALAAIANLLMSDGVVSPGEHNLIDEFHALMAAIPPDREPETLKTVVPNLARQFATTVRRVLSSLRG